MYIGYLISPTGDWPTVPIYADVRDAARAHILALDASPSVQSRRRILFSTPDVLENKDILEVIKKARPKLAERLIQTPEPEYLLKKIDLDYKRIEEVLGMKTSDFYTVEQECRQPARM